MPKLGKEYDVVVAGAGINGIAAAAYLQKAGLNVAVFERRAEAGVHCCTEELMYPGVKLNLCATMIHTLCSPAWEDLELEKFGLEMLHSGEWHFCHAINRTKKAVLIHGWDARKQYEAWQRISEKDAETYRKMINYFAPQMVDWVEMAFFRPQTVEVGAGMAESLAKCPGLPPDWMEMTALEVIQEVIKDENIRAMFYAYHILGGTHLWDKGHVGLLLPLILPSIFGGYMSRGGSHAVAHALCRCFAHYGGSFFPNCPVEKITIEDGEAKGVVLSKDAVYPEAEIRATRAVISNLSCRPTFKDLVGLDKLSLLDAAAVMTYRYDDICLFTTYFALKESLDWQDFPPEVANVFCFTFGIEGDADAERFMLDMACDRLPDPPVVCGPAAVPTLADPTQAPPGHHALMTWADVTYDLWGLGGPQVWDDIREDYGDKVENLLNEYTPNLKTAKLARYCNSPLDYYRRNPSAIKGSAISGANILSQMGHNCPFPGCSAPRSPIAKLYLSNVSSGGNTTKLGGGYKAAYAIAEDLGVGEQDWWAARAVEPGERWLKKRGITPHWSVG
jgi:phytoene dehydrogenase-like protein